MSDFQFHTIEEALEDAEYQIVDKSDSDGNLTAEEEAKTVYKVDGYLEMKPICNGHKHSKMEKNIAFIIQFGKIKHTSKRCLLS